MTTKGMKKKDTTTTTTTVAPVKERATVQRGVPFRPNISEHITYKEATKNFVTHVNYPNIPQVQAMKVVAKSIFEPLWEWDHTITILSFFRSKLVASHYNYQFDNLRHFLGEEIDLSVGQDSVHTNNDLFEFIYHNLPYDELVWDCAFETSAFENTSPPWVHVNLKKQNHLNRHKAFRNYLENGKVKRNRVYRFLGHEDFDFPIRTTQII